MLVILLIDYIIGNLTYVKKKVKEGVVMADATLVQEQLIEP